MATALISGIFDELCWHFQVISRHVAWSTWIIFYQTDNNVSNFLLPNFTFPTPFCTFSLSSSYSQPFPLSISLLNGIFSFSFLWDNLLNYHHFLTQLFFSPFTFECVQDPLLLLTSWLMTILMVSTERESESSSETANYKIEEFNLNMFKHLQKTMDSINKTMVM